MGDTQDDDHIRFEAVLVPCNYLHTMLDYQGDSIHPECVGDLEEQIKYVGPSHAIIYVNQERINPVGFDQDAIETYSEI